MRQISDFAFPSAGSKVLLINTHAYDLRLPWSQWHQPTGLLQLGSFLLSLGIEVKFIDCLRWDTSATSIPRRKVGSIDVGSYNLDLWRFGASWEKLNRYANTVKKSGWYPDFVYVSCGQTTWWEAAKDLITLIKNKWFPKATVILGGVYPALEPEHAQNTSGADIVVANPPTFAGGNFPDIKLYPEGYRPSFAGVYLYQPTYILDTNKNPVLHPRSVSEIADEIKSKIELGIHEFAFFDDEIVIDHREHFQSILKQLSGLDIRLVAIGNIAPSFIDQETAKLMYEAGYAQIYLKCGVERGKGKVNFTDDYEAYIECAAALHSDGKFKSRSGSVVAMLQLGNPYEDIPEITERLVNLSSIVGAVSLVQYQYPSGERNDDELGSLIGAENDLTSLNCKLYPLGRATGNSFEDYIELTRLSALLNSKYRGKTFDFLGDSLTARLVRKSMANQKWKPFSISIPEFDSEIIPLLPKITNEGDTS